MTVSFNYKLIALFLLIFFSKNALAKDVPFKIWDISQKDVEIIEFKKVMIPEKEKTPESILKKVFSGEQIPEILIIKNGTAYVNIPGDSDIITNRSGSAGAMHYQAKIVFNLTEFAEINYVYFVDEGEHFNPGKYERIDYWYLLSPVMKISYRNDIEKRLNPKSGKTAYYVYILTEIGDIESIKALEKLKGNYKRLGFRCVSIDIDSAINKIRKRVKGK